MIKSIVGGMHVIVDGGYTSNPYIYNSSKELVGQLKYNTNTQNMEVYDGSSWLPLISSQATVKLAPAAERAIDWVINRINEEKEWEDSDHPAVKAAYENLRKARQQVEVTAILVKQEENNVNTTS